MHLKASSILVSLVALLLPSVAASRLFRPGANVRNVIAERQFRVRREIGDKCVSLSGTEFAKKFSLPLNRELEELSVVTCKKDFGKWLANDPNGKALQRSIGPDAAKKSLHMLFFGSPTVERRQAPSGISTNARRSMSIMTLVQAKQTCRINESVCGVAGREDDAQAFECIDTRSSLDHCGGCVVPHPFYEPYRMKSKGVECGRLPHVISARCKESRCVVTQCKNGFEPGHDKTKCVPATSGSVDDRVLMDNASPAFQLVQREVAE